MNTDKHRWKFRFIICVHLCSSVVYFLFCGAAFAQLQPNDFVAITGDSITEQKLYSVFIEDYLLMCQPKAGLRTMQFGWSGDTSWGFLARVENDCLRFKPTLVTTCFGMNDGGYQPADETRQNKYREATIGLVESFQKAGVRTIVLGSPGCVDSFTFRNDPEKAAIYNQTLAAERDIVRDVAKSKNLAFADVYEAMFTAMAKAKEQYGKEYHVAGADGVHPAANGHLVMAYAFLKAMGCDGAIGTISIDLSSKSATASNDHNIISFDGQRLMIESKRYPFCFPADPKLPISSPGNVRGILSSVPFNEQLNRFMLIVTNAPVQKYKITWGETEKEFTSQQLAAGINLAAEFLDNPFVEPFKQADEAVRAQQGFETPMIKCLVHMTHFELPDETKLLEDVLAATSKKQQLLADRATATVKAVTHTIRFEEVK